MDSAKAFLELCAVEHDEERWELRLGRWAGVGEVDVWTLSRLLPLGGTQGCSDSVNEWF